MGVDLDELKAALAAVLDERSRIAELDHRAHHAWIDAKMQREKARTEFLQTLASKSLPAIMWMILVAAATAVGRFINSHWHW